MIRQWLLAGVLALGAPSASFAATSEGVDTRADDVFATGNEWLALPEIRADDAALLSFNVLSARDRGLVEARGDATHPVLQPHFEIDGRKVVLNHLHWSLTAQWIPTATQTVDGVEYQITYCVPDGYRAGFVRLVAHNTTSQPVPLRMGVHTAFGALNRVTYVPVALRGERRVGPAPWVSPGVTYSFVTDDTHFAFALIHPGSTPLFGVPPASALPEADAVQMTTLAPGASVQANYVLAVGTEEFSAAHAGRALKEALDRLGAETIIERAAAWCEARFRHTGQSDLDALMNRNLLFTRLYAWGRTLDTETLVGVTSRSPRYYVSAAYWDRDAMLWSFPGLLDSDPAFAADALDYALGPQLRNVGTHSRFIDGTVLEDGFQLDEAAAPLIALGQYLAATGDTAFVQAHAEAIRRLSARLEAHRDSHFGLYESMQDSQDEYQRLRFLTLDNVLVWQALNSLAALRSATGDRPGAAAARAAALGLHAAIEQHLLTSTAPARFLSAWDPSGQAETDIPPGSLLQLPALGFLGEDDPRFQATYAYLHSPAYPYSYSTRPYGLPGSYRLPFTTVWTLAAELSLHSGRERALSILRASHWDNGIATEGIDPTTAQPDTAGRAFATAAGALAHALCRAYCTDAAPRLPAAR